MAPDAHTEYKSVDIRTENKVETTFMKVFWLFYAHLVEHFHTLLHQCGLACACAYGCVICYREEMTQNLLIQDDLLQLPPVYQYK